MNAYLVLLRHTMDDLPIALFGDRDRAVKFAQKTRPQPTDAIRNFYNADCATPVAVVVVEFVRGKPKRFVFSKDVD